MKKLLCILLSCILVFNSVFVVHADIGGSFDPLAKLKEEHPDLFDENGHMKPSLTQSVGSKLFEHMIVPDLIKGGEETADKLASLTGAIGEFLNTFDNSNDDVTVKYNNNGQPVTDSNYNENNFYITYSPKFLNGLNSKLQENVHALDGYYLFEPQGNISLDNFRKLEPDFLSSASKNDINNYCSDYTFVFVPPLNKSYGYLRFYTPRLMNGNQFLSVMSDGEVWLQSYNSSNGHFSVPLNGGHFYYYKMYSSGGLDSPDDATFTLSELKKYSNRILGSPFKVFYSDQDYLNWLNKGRSYAPKLPSTNLTVPLGYANGTLNLPDFNINLDSLIGKAEADIQADIDNQFKLYLDKLAEINVNPSQPTNPTPTPSGGGSGGDFGDGTTPTPAPDFTDGLKDTNDLLTQILEKVTSILQIDTDFSKSFETVSQNLCKYLESNNEKLDQIITAINALSNGKTEDEVNGCKYDFTQLSQSLTSLWNDSDQKFDQMIKLLEENNKYQEKIIGDLNDIKAILIAQTVLDAFQNRSQETANKAKEKFPTSIPWDIAMIVNTFSAEPEPIKFELPIKVNSLNINETITVDLSSGEWEKLGKLCRYMLSVLFILFLIQLSRKLFSNGGDE